MDHLQKRGLERELRAYGMPRNWAMLAVSRVNGAIERGELCPQPSLLKAPTARLSRKRGKKVSVSGQPDPRVKFFSMVERLTISQGTHEGNKA